MAGIFAFLCYYNFEDTSIPPYAQYFLYAVFQLKLIWLLWIHYLTIVYRKFAVWIDQKEPRYETEMLVEAVKIIDGVLLFCAFFVFCNQLNIDRQAKWYLNN